jgi:protein TonB
VTGRPVRAFGWAAAGVASVALLSGAALALTLTRPSGPEPLFLTMDPTPPASPTVAALADPAPTVADEVATLAEPAVPFDEPATTPQVADPVPTDAPAPLASTPPPETPVAADLSLPEPVIRPKARPARVETRKVEQPKEPVEPKTATAQPAETKPASAGSSAPRAGTKVDGGKKTSPAAYARAVMKQVRATRAVSGAGKGTVVVGFSIAPDGGLAAVRVLQSSGNAALDQIAADHIRRSAPFPAPPEGVGTSYSFEFVGR